jgi:hypothetical protein
MTDETEVACVKDNMANTDSERIVIDTKKYKIVALCIVPGDDSWAVCNQCPCVSDGDPCADSGSCPQCGSYIAYKHNIRLIPMTRWDLMWLRFNMWVAGVKASYSGGS